MRFASYTCERKRRVDPDWWSLCRNYYCLCMEVCSEI